ncbi:ion transporter [Noviherbaspirillum aerium]|uniref:ion transporter n=1 Tax=Noviherbaspirillum aerium TaxID=2588497 RepID=UPI001CEF6EEE|nr:ion transporter [Noviherbaspirillum aerium]
MEAALETPLAVCGLLWLALMVVELVRGLGLWGTRAVTVIWIIFVIDFLLRFALAPRKLAYVRRNWFTAIALVLPALRVFRFVRAFRILGQLRGLRLVRILSSVNRSMRALGKTIRRRGFGYVSALTLLVTLSGAAGMMSFESSLSEGEGLNDFSSALWWTAMLMTTMGSEYWPKTAEGRLLCLGLAIYAFAVFGYVTGTIATYFIGQDVETERSSAKQEEKIDRLIAEVAALRSEIQNFKMKMD